MFYTTCFFKPVKPTALMFFCLGLNRMQIVWKINKTIHIKKNGVLSRLISSYNTYGVWIVEHRYNEPSLLEREWHFMLFTSRNYEWLIVKIATSEIYYVWIFHQIIALVNNTNLFIVCVLLCAIILLVYSYWKGVTNPPWGIGPLYR